VNPHAHISPETRFVALERPFELESGERISGVEIAFRAWGVLSAARDNAVVVCHALTGSADVDRWWGRLLGAGRALDPGRDFVVAANALGSCYGTTGPASPRPGARAGTEARWGPDFPAITIRDQVRLAKLLLDRLGVERIRLVVGGSLGGLQALEWALLDRERVDAVATISASARHSAWAIALSELGRRALELDPKFREGRYPETDPPAAGLALARAIAMASYRSRTSLERRFGRARRFDRRFEVESYLAHQGAKLVDRFDANAYRTLLDAMDTHDVARGRGELAQVLGGVGIPILVVASTSDVLYPPEEQRELAALLPAAELAVLDSPDGHDAFLTEAERLERIVAGFRARLEAAPAPRVAAGAAR
jgi:homoserine O-acetyltransferase/O-succinyltransferase